VSASNTKGLGLQQGLVLGIFFLSGVAGLIYEILWMRQLAQLFGSTSQSAAVTTAAFFIGIAAGSYYWGQQASTLKNPLKTYAILEFGIVAAGLFYFLLFQLYFLLYSSIFEIFTGSGLLFWLVKILLAVFLICPASFLMGGTLPVMGEYLIKDRQQIGRWAGTLYAINTLGAVLGAIAAGFFLPRMLGLNLTYSLALSLSFLLGLAAWFLANNSLSSNSVGSSQKQTAKSEVSKRSSLFGQFELIEFVALLSGFLSLGMQVLWIRMFVQVLQNSTYTFSAVLVIFLAAIAIGALCVRVLNQYLSTNLNTLLILMVLAGMACLVSPYMFMVWTNGLSYLGQQDQLSGYLFEVIISTGAIIGLPAIIMGMVLPYLYRYTENLKETPGATLGRLNSWNTIGAVTGPLVASFILLPAMGLWNSVLLLGLAYVAVPLVLLQSIHTRVATVGALALILIFINPTSLPVVRINADEERLLDVWEGPDGTVAVVERNGSRRVKLNNWYALGGSGALRMEQIQTHLPMHIHPDPKSVFYLGLGSGITAGTVLNYPIEKATVAELSSEVITASDQYFSEFTNDLHRNDLVEVVHEDGRNFLAGTQEKFDLIIADLFIPWRAGVALLYTQEHFQSAKERLNADGLFVQWVPLYQISERELRIIANTMAESFPMVSLWRGDFYAEQPILAMVGHLDIQPLSTNTAIVQRSLADLASVQTGESEQIPLISYYLGTLNSDSSWYEGSALNTDNLPIIEYVAPESHRAERAGLLEWFVGKQMIGFMQKMQQYAEPTQDAYLSELNSELHSAIYAGLFFHIAAVARREDNLDASTEAAAIGQELISLGN